MENQNQINSILQKDDVVITKPLKVQGIVGYKTVVFDECGEITMLPSKWLNKYEEKPTVDEEMSKLDEYDNLVAALINSILMSCEEDVAVDILSGFFTTDELTKYVNLSELPNQFFYEWYQETGQAFDNHQIELDFELNQTAETSGSISLSIGEYAELMSMDREDQAQFIIDKKQIDSYDWRETEVQVTDLDE